MKAMELLTRFGMVVIEKRDCKKDLLVFDRGDHNHRIEREKKEVERTEILNA